MSKKNKEVLLDDMNVENTEVEAEANDNITPDVVNVEAEAPEVNSDVEEEKEEVKEMVTLKVEVNFTDKYDNSIKYVKGKEYSFNAERANELLNDKRGLVSKVK